MKTNGFIRTGKERTILDLAQNESYHLGLNDKKYTLNEIVVQIIKMKKEQDFPNLILLNEKTPGILVYNCGGMAVLKLPYDERNEKKKLKTKKIL